MLQASRLHENSGRSGHPRQGSDLPEFKPVGLEGCFSRLLLVFLCKSAEHLIPLNQNFRLSSYEVLFENDAREVMLVAVFKSFQIMRMIKMINKPIRPAFQLNITTKETACSRALRLIFNFLGYYLFQRTQYLTQQINVQVSDKLLWEHSLLNRASDFAGIGPADILLFHNMNLTTRLTVQSFVPQLCITIKRNQNNLAGSCLERLIPKSPNTQISLHTNNLRKNRNRISPQIQKIHCSHIEYTA